MTLRDLFLAILLMTTTVGTATADNNGNSLGNEDLVARIQALENIVVRLQQQIDANQASNTAAIGANAAGISDNSDAITLTNQKLMYVTVVEGEINGVAGPHFIIEGANVHVRSGAGSTGEGCFAGNAADCPTRTGLGNLIIGYNEPRPVQFDPNGLCASNPDATDPDTGIAICTRRDGAHHLVVGQGNNFIGHGGTVLGLFNEARGSHTSVTGGRGNAAAGPYASVSGGLYNVASRSLSTVAGGWSNRADGPASSVSGGRDNVASGESSTVSAGQLNIAAGPHSAVSGGNFNNAGGEAATVGGGNGNSAGGPWSTVSGGEANQANAFGAVVSGGRANAAQGDISAVSGGRGNSAWGISSSVSGGIDKQAVADGCTVGDNGTDC